MKISCLTILLTFLASSSYAQWTTTTNITNTNTGYVGVKTGLYVSQTLQNGSLTPGSVVVGEPQMGTNILAPAASSFQHYITLDQANNQVYISCGNSDVGGGFSRPGINTGETRIFSNGNINNSSSYLTFYTLGAERARFDINGNLSIGTINASGYKLAVKGGIHAQQITVDATNWPDFVFEPGYKLTPLNSVAQFIQANHHLPGLKPAAQVQKDGINVGDNQAKLLQKIEELTLYVIAQDKKQQQQQQINDKQNQLIEQQGKLLKQMQDRLDVLEKKNG